MPIIWSHTICMNEPGFVNLKVRLENERIYEYAPDTLEACEKVLEDLKSGQVSDETLKCLKSAVIKARS